MEYTDRVRDHIRIAKLYDKYFDIKDVLILIGHRELSEMEGVRIGTKHIGKYEIDGIPMKLLECESVFSITTKTAYKAILNMQKRDLLYGIERLRTLTEEF